MGEFVKIVEETVKKMKFEEGMYLPYADAYWISPDNWVIPVPERHITMIDYNPEKFGLSDQFIKQVHKKHKEKIGSEGNAREEIMVELIKKGWIRIRKAGDYWTIQIDKLTPENSNKIEQWARLMIKLDKKYVYSAIILIDMKGTEYITKTDDVRFSDAVKRSKKWMLLAYGAGKQSLMRQFRAMDEGVKLKIAESIEKYPGVNNV